MTSTTRPSLADCPTAAVDWMAGIVAVMLTALTVQMLTHTVAPNLGLSLISTLAVTIPAVGLSAYCLAAGLVVLRPMWERAMLSGVGLGCMAVVASGWFVLMS